MLLAEPLGDGDAFGVNFPGCGLFLQPFQGFTEVVVGADVVGPVGDERLIRVERRRSIAALGVLLGDREPRERIVGVVAEEVLKQGEAVQAER